MIKINELYYKMKNPFKTQKPSLEQRVAILEKTISRMTQSSSTWNYLEELEKEERRVKREAMFPLPSLRVDSLQYQQPSKWLPIRK